MCCLILAASLAIQSCNVVRVDRGNKIYGFTMAKLKFYYIFPDAICILCVCFCSTFYLFNSIFAMLHMSDHSVCINAIEIYSWSIQRFQQIGLLNLLSKRKFSAPLLLPFHCNFCSSFEDTRNECKRWKKKEIRN